MTTARNERKPLIINAFAMATSGHQSPGLWKHPEDKSPEYNTIEYWTNLAELLERGKFHSVFFADVLGGYDVYNGPQNITAAATSGAQWPVNEPSAVVAAMAAVTTNLSFGITFSTISEAPYHFARRLATLDHLTEGRVGWNVVSSYLESGSRNLLNGAALPPHEERYLHAEEYLQVVYQLVLASWRDDAVVKDRKTGVYSEPSRIREINFEGEYFKVPGPNITEPTPQRLPVILQAGTSKAGINFAAKNAEAVFLAAFTPESLREKIKEIRRVAAEKYGREDDAVKAIQLITTVIAETHEEAEAKYEEYKSYGDLEGAQALLSGWSGIDFGKYGYDEELGDVESNAVKSFVEALTQKATGEPEGLRKTREYLANKVTIGGVGPVIFGTPVEVADELERWVDISGVDGFNFAYAVSPGSFETIVDLLLPELRLRGLAWEDYPASSTFRESIFGNGGIEPGFVRPSHPAYGLRWRAGVTRKEFEQSLEEVRLKWEEASNRLI
ncbi:hypothetical protein BABINDRAFT_29930 [Babjeviella inositovora NRRL Y-12698]|uniref:Luciferase-like domain-containing protein n=1 Tax=Babjeviella inositovora NRRL Y-12698 TaxID=984486 RepID=A0A1E3QZS5_9ASCO|nr:uncharacterized protein BABINDRAFT_29930 [Babjeviella inositovora NRRL Y-12698]ODQ82587.1 hypothetical protein BABINDRAFT_29930 [Babjeviella inositovora NRRL Y-12698]